MKQITITSLADVTKAAQWVAHWLSKGLAGGKAVVITLKHENRTEAQNRHLWPLLTCFAKQKEYGSKLRSNEEWKVILISAYKFDPAGIVIGLNGEVVNLNYSSSQLSKEQFSEFIESIYAQGCEWGIKWSDPALEIYEQWSSE